MLTSFFLSQTEEDPHLTLLHKALEDPASTTEAVVRTLALAWPNSTVFQENQCTPLHVLASAYLEDSADCKHTNALCFALLERKHALNSLTIISEETFRDKKFELKTTLRTPIDIAADNENRHLIATLHEVSMFKKHSHLSLMHFRDWTTVSHAWCTPSAKLTALTVLLVGETYKRGLLPRLPMDCWYRILNMIPRHELRVGVGCTLKEETAALVDYKVILWDAKVGVNPATKPLADPTEGRRMVQLEVDLVNLESYAKMAPPEAQVWDEGCYEGYSGDEIFLDQTRDRIEAAFSLSEDALSRVLTIERSRNLLVKWGSNDVVNEKWPLVSSSKYFPAPILVALGQCWKMHF